MNQRVVLTVSGNIPPNLREQIASGQRPRTDYIELARGLNADLIDYAAARTISGRMGAVLEKLAGPNVVLAYACWKIRKSCKAIITDGEQVGLPLATLLKLSPGKRPRHLMIVHVMSEPKKIFFLDWLRVQSVIDRFITYSRWQQRFIADRWKLNHCQVLWTPFMVDQKFFDPCRTKPNVNALPQICAVGLERRDYETLLQAVQDIDVRVVIAAASPWSKRSAALATRTIPNNVTVQKFTQYELRQLYADSRFMVMPLQNVTFQAGITAILECMSMGKAVLCTRVPGQTDAVAEGDNGRYVPPRDPLALRVEISRMLSNSEETARMGSRGRDLIESQINIDLYVETLAGFLRDALRYDDSSPLAKPKKPE